MADLDLIVRDPKILAGKPVVKGTRLSVEFILGLFADGWVHEQLLDNYPSLTPEALCAVFAFAAQQLEQEPQDPTRSRP